MTGLADSASRHIAILLQLRPLGSPETACPPPCAGSPGVPTGSASASPPGSMRVTFTPEEELALLRIAQEAVANAVRARARVGDLDHPAGAPSRHGDGAGSTAATAGLCLALVRAPPMSGRF
jgi:hypothetical protein